MVIKHPKISPKVAWLTKSCITQLLKCLISVIDDWFYESWCRDIFVGIRRVVKQVILKRAGCSKE